MDNQSVTRCPNKEHLKKIEEMADHKTEKMTSEFDCLAFQMLFIKEGTPSYLLKKTNCMLNVCVALLHSNIVFYTMP